MAGFLPEPREKLSMFDFKAAKGFGGHRARLRKFLSILAVMQMVVFYHDSVSFCLLCFGALFLVAYTFTITVFIRGDWP